MGIYPVSRTPAPGAGDADHHRLGPFWVARCHRHVGNYRRNIHGRQHRPVGDGEGVAVHGVVHLFVDDVGALLRFLSAIKSGQPELAKAMAQAMKTMQDDGTLAAIWRDNGLTWLTP